jgi:hypothetical protein
MTTQLKFFFFLLIFISCNQNPTVFTGKEYVTKGRDTSSLIQANRFEEEKFLSQEFVYDTVYRFYKQLNLEVDVILPRLKKSSWKYNIEAAALSKKEIKSFKARVDKMVQDDSAMVKTVPSIFSFIPVSAYKDNKIVSCCFSVQKYCGGAAHPLFEYCSINYDPIGKRLLKFENYFSLKSKKDSVLLLNKINTSIKEAGIELTKLNALDFNVEEKQVSFNFDAYELGYGDMPLRVVVNKTELSTLIKDHLR